MGTVLLGCFADRPMKPPEGSVVNPNITIYDITPRHNQLT